MRRCPRCGATFEIRRADDRYCPPCHRDVVTLIEADTQRRLPRFAVAKSLDGWRAVA